MAMEEKFAKVFEWSKKAPSKSNCSIVPDLVQVITNQQMCKRLFKFRRHEMASSQVFDSKQRHLRKCGYKKQLQAKKKASAFHESWRRGNRKQGGKLQIIRREGWCKHVQFRVPAKYTIKVTTRNAQIKESFRSADRNK